MDLLKPAVNQTAFLKAGFFGFQGSGKTYTACEIAIGLCHLIKNHKVAFFDTEAGSDYMIPKFKKAELELFVHKGRAFKDLCSIVREAEKNGFGVLIIDSISHVWREIQDAYKTRIKRDRLYMQDWGSIKGQWQEFTDLFLNSHLHIIMLGRAGFEYDNEVNEDTHKKELVKVGTKMKVEAEMGYEPSLLIEMEAILDEKAGRFAHIATILKDRSDLMNGQSLRNPKFADFKPIIEFLNLGGEHVAVDTQRSSVELFKNPDYSYEELKKKRAIALEELQEALVLSGLDGRSNEAVIKRTTLLKDVFGSSSKTYIDEKVPFDKLIAGVQDIKSRMKPKEETSE